MAGMLRFGVVFVFAVATACSASDDGRDSDDTGSDSGTGEDGGGDASGDGDADTDGDGGDTDTDSFGVGCERMDILFVIDNSESMTAEQNALAASFPKFVEVLDAYRNPDNEPIDYRIGVTTSSVNRTFTWNFPAPAVSIGEDGKLLGEDICDLEDPWIDGPATDPGLDAGVDGGTGESALAKKFSCMAHVGADGAAVEMPFAALELALGKKSEPGGPNEGFYRREQKSLLIVVFITDEDDCSIEQGGYMKVLPPDPTGRTCHEQGSNGLYTVEDTKKNLDSVAGGAGRYVVVGIGGGTMGGCDSAFGHAAFAQRVKRLVEQVGDEHGAFSDICAGDIWLGLEQALDVIQLSCDTMPPPV